MTLHSLAFDRLERLRRHHNAPRSLGSSSNTLRTTHRDYSAHTELRDTRSFQGESFSLQDLRIELKRTFHPPYPDAWVPLNPDSIETSLTLSQLPPITLHSIGKGFDPIPREACTPRTGAKDFDARLAIVTQANASTLQQIFQDHTLRKTILDLLAMGCTRIDLFGFLTPIRATFASNKVLDLLKPDNHTQTVDLLCTLGNHLPHITVDAESPNDPHTPDTDPNDSWNQPAPQTVTYDGPQAFVGKLIVAVALLIFGLIVYVFML